MKPSFTPFEVLQLIDMIYCLDEMELLRGILHEEAKRYSLSDYNYICDKFFEKVNFIYIRDTFNANS
jgi:hypothetical protein